MSTLWVVVIAAFAVLAVVTAVLIACEMNRDLNTRMDTWPSDDDEKGDGE